jgi:hypothetical protein
MPLDFTSRNIAAGGASPYIPLITNNPAFQVKITPMDGRLEQKPNQTKDTAEQNKIKIGDTVRGEEVSGTKKRGERVIGRVIAIEMEDGAITGYKVINQKGDDMILDPTTTVKMDEHGEDPTPMTAPQTQLENYSPTNGVMLYEDWKNAQVK